MTFSTKKGATAEETALLRGLKEYSPDTVTWLHNAFDLCGGFDGDGEVFLVSEEVLTALKQLYYTTGGTHERKVLEAALQVAARPPTDPLLLLAAVIDAACEELAARCTRSNSTLNAKLICMMASAEELLPDAMNSRLWTTVDGVQQLYLKEGLTWWQSRSRSTRRLSSRCRIITKTLPERRRSSRTCWRRWPLR